MRIARLVMVVAAACFAASSLTAAQGRGNGPAGRGPQIARGGSAGPNVGGGRTGGGNNGNAGVTPGDSGKRGGNTGPTPGNAGDGVRMRAVEVAAMLARNAGMGVASW